MSEPVVEVKVRALAATSGGCAVFLGNEDKVFVMFVDQSVGTAITMFMQDTPTERPLTHDLVANILRALGAKIESVIVNDFKLGTYYARLVLSAENELQQKKVIEIDARPSDCIAMATAAGAEDEDEFDSLYIRVRMLCPAYSAVRSAEPNIS